MGGVLTLLPNDTRTVVRRGLRGMPYSKDWIAYMNALADQKPLKPTDGPFVFKSTMEYSETGSTLKLLARLIPRVLDLPDTATKAFVDIGLTNGVLPASDSILPSSDLAVLPVPTRDISPPVATSTLALVLTAVLLRYSPFQPPLLLPANSPACSSSNSSILERGYGYRKLDSIQFLTLCQAYLLQIEEHQCSMYVAFATGSLTWHEAVKSNNAAEAKEAVLKELRTLTNLKSRRYLHSVSDKTSSVHNKITVPTLLLKPKYDAAGGFLLWKGRLVSGGHMTLGF